MGKYITKAYDNASEGLEGGGPASAWTTRFCAAKRAEAVPIWYLERIRGLAVSS